MLRWPQLTKDKAWHMAIERNVKAKEVTPTLLAESSDNCQMIQTVERLIKCNPICQMRGFQTRNHLLDHEFLKSRRRQTGGIVRPGQVQGFRQMPISFRHFEPDLNF